MLKRQRCPITDDIEICSDSDRENSDEETSNEQNSDEENVDEKNFKTPIKFFKFFFLYIKKWQLNIIKNKKKAFKKGSWNVPKPFWRRIKQKARIFTWAI